MSASKRKVTAGGYDDSSDYDSEKAYREIPLGQSTSKRPKSSSPATSSSQQENPTLSRFLLPKWSSLKPSSGYATSTPGPTSSQETDWVVLDSPTPQALDSINPKGIRTRNPKALDSVQLDPIQIQQDKARLRPSISFERQINALTTSMEEDRKQADKQHNELKSTLDQILAIVRRIEDSHASAAGDARTDPIHNSVPINRLECANPEPTDELRTIVTRVVNNARHRVGTKKSGPEENAIKEHGRTSFYGMLGISAAKDVRPCFWDAHGEPDTLPTFARDLATGWIPTFIVRFQGTIPNDGSPASHTLRGLSDEQIVILLADGPFKSGCAAWRNRQKDVGVVEVQKSVARRGQRTMRKRALRMSYISSNLPELQGPEWEHLTHPGFISADESDSEGELTTMRPSNRSSWLNNTFDAMNVANDEKIRARLGPNARIPARRIVIVDRPIPSMTRGSGTNTLPLRVALCSLSKGWRDAHPEQLQEAAHLVDFNITSKPSIDHFLAQHPMDFGLGESTVSHSMHDEQPTGAGPIEGGENGVEDFPIDPQLLQDERSSQIDGAKGTQGVPPPPPLDEVLPTPELGTPVPKKRGRPKKSTTGVVEVSGRVTRAHNSTSTQSVSDSQQSGVEGGEVSQVKKRGPGRPPGVKNKK